MFIGQYHHTLDDKGRVIIPAKFRPRLLSKFVMTKGLDNCLFIYPLVEWKVLEEKLTKLPLSNKDARAFVRFFFSGACEVKLDKQGRVLIPSNLREYIKIEKDVIIIGLAKRLELWSEKEWERYNSNQNLSYEDMAESMSKLGI